MLRWMLVCGLGGGRVSMVLGRVSRKDLPKSIVRKLGVSAWVGCEYIYHGCVRQSAEAVLNCQVCAPWHSWIVEDLEVRCAVLPRWLTRSLACRCGRIERV
jgi:hypothetical protein